MRRTIKINGKYYKFKSSAAIPRMYRIKFGRDIFVDLEQLAKQVEVKEKLKKEMKEKCEKEGKPFREEDCISTLPISSLELFENIAFLMNKHGDPKQPSDVDKWLEQFETFDIYSILPQIVDMWNIENKQMSKPKKERGK